MLKTVAVASCFAVPALVLSACASPDQPSSSPGTTPSVWTGSPAPSAQPGGQEGGHGGGQEGQASGETLKADLKSPNGTTVAKAEIAFSGNYATITVESAEPGALAPGFHGLHIHSVGKCEANSVAPAGGAPGDFNSAGGHLQVAGHSGHPMSGDLTSLQVREDGSAMLVTTTDAFTAEDLTGEAGTAIIIHEKADNFANIPPERYNQPNGTPGPDQMTMTTGDAGKRVACGVIGAG